MKHKMVTFAIFLFSFLLQIGCAQEKNTDNNSNISVNLPLTNQLDLTDFNKNNADQTVNALSNHLYPLNTNRLVIYKLIHSEKDIGSLEGFVSLSPELAKTFFKNRKNITEKEIKKTKEQQNLIIIKDPSLTKITNNILGAIGELQNDSAKNSEKSYPNQKIHYYFNTDPDRNTISGDQLYWIKKNENFIGYSIPPESFQNKWKEMAAKENSSIPYFSTNKFENTGRDFDRIVPTNWKELDSYQDNSSTKQIKSKHILKVKDKKFVVIPIIEVSNNKSGKHIRVDYFAPGFGVIASEHSFNRKDEGSITTSMKPLIIYPIP